MIQKLSKTTLIYRYLFTGCLLIILILFLLATPRDQLGDVNNDGDVNVADIVLVVDIILTDGIEYGDYELWASDVNVDETTDVIDIVLIIPVILEFDNCEEQYSPCTDNFSLCCPDSTGHEFTWEIETFGNYGSRLYDVAIVNENNIWVVGDIITDEGEYNAAHWDGINWELTGIYSNTLDLYSIHYFSDDDIWVTDYCSPIHWDGNEWTLYHLQNMGFDVCVGNALWGTSSSNIYFVGWDGAIVHYDGMNFTQMDSGTDIQLNDIDGTVDGNYIFVAGRNNSGESIALMIHNEEVITLYEGENMFSEPYGGIKVVSVYNDSAYFASQMGFWKYNFLTDSSSFIPGDEIYFTNRGIRSINTQAVNDLSIITYWSELIHFNGSTWYLDTTVLDQFGPYNIQAQGMDFKENIVVSVGYVWGPAQAFVARGFRD